MYSWVSTQNHAGSLRSPHVDFRRSLRRVRGVVVEEESLELLSELPVSVRIQEYESELHGPSCDLPSISLIPSDAIAQELGLTVQLSPTWDLYYKRLFTTSSYAGEFTVIDYIFLYPSWCLTLSPQAVVPPAASLRAALLRVLA